MLHITHILLSWPVSVVFPNRKQFVRVNRMPYIAHTLIWLPVSVVLPHRNSSNGLTVCPASHTHCYGCSFLLFCLIADSLNGLTVCPASHTQLKSELCLTAPPLQTFCTFLTGFLHHRLRLLHRTQFRQRVSDRSVALAVSCSSCMLSLLYWCYVNVDYATSWACVGFPLKRKGWCSKVA